jgi:uncharacterized Fe-S cluster-containing radical SAM superfamily protein
MNMFAVRAKDSTKQEMLFWILQAIGKMFEPDDGTAISTDAKNKRFEAQYRFLEAFLDQGLTMHEAGRKTFPDEQQHRILETLLCPSLHGAEAEQKRQKTAP